MLSDEEHEEPVFVFGEAKSFGRNAFDNDSISNLREVAECFPGSFMIASTLKPIVDYSSEELKLLKGLAQWGRIAGNDGRPRNPLIILTGTELFANRGIREAWGTGHGPDLNDLYQLAEITQQRYLSLPPFYIDWIELNRQRARLVALLKERSRFYRV